jgi:hypothetical protein
MAAFMMPVALGMASAGPLGGPVSRRAAAALVVAITPMVLGVWESNPLARNVLSEAVAATVVFALSARWYRAEDPRHAEIERLDRDLRTPVPDAPVASHAGLAVYGVIGTMTLALGAVLSLAAPSCRARPSLQPGRNLVAGLLLNCHRSRLA